MPSLGGFDSHTPPPLSIRICQVLVLLNPKPVVYRNADVESADGVDAKVAKAVLSTYHRWSKFLTSQIPNDRLDSIKYDAGDRPSCGDGSA